jgi:ABC-type multidrug transport system permease subunit
MSISIVYASNLPLRATLKTLAFLCASFAAIFSASAGYGLLKMLFVGMSSGADIGVAEFVTHSGLTIGFFVAAGLGAYGAKKCFW